ncbi:MAG: YgjV family protein [Clostridia bacterium]|nr:YgjV family protein [Clostridia bacterium]
MVLIVSQVIGFLAVASFLLSYQLKKRKNIILCNVLSRCLYILQYVLLGAFEGAVLDVLGAISSVIAAKKHLPFIKKHTKIFVVCMDLIIVAAGLLLYVNPFSLLPIAGVLLHTTAFWINDEKIIRRVSLLGSPFWMIYNFSCRAYGSAVGDFLTMVSIVIAMVKYRNQKNNSEESAEVEKYV